MATHFADLLMQLTSDTSSNNTNIELIGKQIIWENANFEKIERLTKDLLGNCESRKEIFSIAFRPALGHLMSLLLDSLTDDNDINCRLKSARFLCHLTRYEFVEESADFIAFALPGLFYKCRVLLDSQSKINSIELVKSVFKLVANAIIVGFSTINIKSDQKSNLGGNEMYIVSVSNFLSFRRDYQWVKMASEKILPEISHLLSRLCVHPTEQIRFESLNMLAEVWKHSLIESFSREFDRIAIDLSIFLYNDSIPRISNLAKQLVLALRNKNKQLFEAHSLNKLKKAIITLELNVKNASDGRKYFENITNLMYATGTGLLDRLFNISEFVDKMLTSLTKIIEVDTSREMVSGSFRKNEYICLPPLRHGLDAKQFARLAEIILSTRNSEKIFDWCYEKIHQNSSVKRNISIIYFAYSLLNALPEGQQCSQFIEDILEMLNSMESKIEVEVVDHQIVDVIPINSDGSCLVQLLLGSLSSFHMRENGIRSARINVDIIYELLKWNSSANFCVKCSAEQALFHLAKTQSFSTISALIESNAQQLIFKLSLDSRDFATRPRFSLVFASMLSKCSNSNILQSVRSFVDDMLLWLDRSNQQNTLLLLRTLNTFLEALFRWYPNLTPSIKNLEYNDNNEEERVWHGERQLETNNDANYPLVIDTVSILNRVKHFLSSSHTPVLLNALSILDHSLHLVCNYENQLLPMIHQNWLSLIRLFDLVDSEGRKIIFDSQKIVMAKAIEVVSTICHLSNDFVYWKIVREFIPRAVDLLQILLNQSTTMGKVYAQNTSYKLQCALLDNVPSILKDANITQQNYEPLKHIIAVYAQEKKLPEQLRDKASKKLFEIDKFTI